MAVGVVRPDRDERHPRAAGGEEGLIGVPAAVMRHLQDVCLQIHAVPDQAGLGVGAQVAGEQDSNAVHGHPGDHRQVVRECGRRGPRRVGSEHLDGHSADRPSVTRHQHRPCAAGAPDEPVEGADPVIGG